MKNKHRSGSLFNFSRILGAAVFILSVALITGYAGQNRVSAATDLTVTNASLLFSNGQQVKLDIQSNDALTWKVFNSLDQELQSGTVASGTSSIDLGSQLDQGIYRVDLTSSSRTDSVRFMVLSKKVLSDDPYYMVQTHYGQTTKLVYNVDRTIGMLKQIGFNGIRDEVSWGRVETTLGQYQMPPFARDYIDKAAAQKMRTLWIADYGNALYNSDRYNVTEPQTIAGFANYVHAFLSMNPDIKMVEVWNEYDGNAVSCDDTSQKGGPAHCYNDLLKAVYERVKPDFPNVQIIGGVTTGNAANNNWQWYRDLFTVGGMSYLDAVSIHPYGSSNNTIKLTAASLNDLMKEFNNGQTKPILVSEFGLPIIGNVTERRQAARIASAVIQYKSIPNVQTVSIYDSIDDGEDPADNQHNFGMFKGSAYFQPTRIATAYEPKLSAQSYYTMRQQLDGLSFVQETPVISDTVSRLDFGKSGKTTKSVFMHMKYNSSGSNAATEVFDVAVDPAETTLVRDMYGNIIQRSQGASSVQLRQFDGPIYVSYVSNEDQEDAPGAPNTGFVRIVSNPLLLVGAALALVLLFVGYRKIRNQG